MSFTSAPTRFTQTNWSDESVIYTHTPIDTFESYWHPWSSAPPRFFSRSTPELERGSSCCSHDTLFATWANILNLFSGQIINPPLRHIQKELLPQHLQFLNYEYQAISVEKQFSSHTRTPLQERK